MASVAEKIQKRKRIVRILMAVLAVLLLVFVGVGAYMVMLWKNGDRLNRATMFVPEHAEGITFARDESGEAQPAETPSPYAGQATVAYNGKEYVLDEDIFSILFMGIDTTDKEQFAQIGLTAHQSDSLILAAVDPEQQKLVMINIPRISMVDVKQYDANFQYARTTRSPICIQYAFGDGKQMSCNLTREAASRLLFNLPISRYISLNLDGLLAANDAIGGVTLTLQEDFTASNHKMKKGVTYTLLGKDAESFVRGRMQEGLDGTTMTRTKRHAQYYKGFFAAAKNKLKEDPMFAFNLYSSLGGSVQTDLSVEEIIYLSKVVANMDMDEEDIYTLEGTVENEELTVDDEALRDLLICVFYKEITE